MAAIHCLGGFLKKTLFCLWFAFPSLTLIPYPVSSSVLAQTYRSWRPSPPASPLFPEECWEPAQGQAVGRMESEVINHQPLRERSGEPWSHLDLEAAEDTSRSCPNPSTPAAFYAVVRAVCLLPPLPGQKSNNVQGPAEAFGS